MILPRDPCPFQFFNCTSIALVRTFSTQPISDYSSSKLLLICYDSHPGKIVRGSLRGPFGSTFSSSFATVGLVIIFLLSNEVMSPDRTWIATKRQWMLHKFYNSAQALSKKNYNDEDSLVSSNHEFQFVQDRGGFRFRRIDRNGGSDVRKKEIISVAPNETPIFLAFFRTTIYFTLKCARVFRELVYILSRRSHKSNLEKVLQMSFLFHLAKVLTWNSQTHDSKQPPKWCSSWSSM